MKNIIFDLDLTLVDSSVAESARSLRNWKEVYNMIPKFKIYDGFDEIFNIIRENNIKVCIVSTAPRSYIERVVVHFNIPCGYIVGYHDAKPIKPHPAPMFKALELMGESAMNIVSFGDRVVDIQSSNAAGVTSVACLWGTKEKDKLLQSGYSYVIVEPNDIIKLLY